MSFLSGRSGADKQLADENIWGADRYQASSALSGAKASGRIGSAGASRSVSEAGDSGKMFCGNPDCSGSWSKPWKSRRRPIFEGHWGCGARCLQALIRGAVRREAGDGMAATDETPHRHRVPLGLVMLAKRLDYAASVAARTRRAEGSWREDRRVAAAGLRDWQRHDYARVEHAVELSGADD